MNMGDAMSKNNKHPSNSIGIRVKQARAKINYNQAKLASESKITPAAISQIESGDRIPSSPVLRRIASTLKVSTDFILGNTDEINFKDLIQNKSVQNFYLGFKGLCETDQKIIEEQIEFLKSRNEKK